MVKKKNWFIYFVKEYNVVLMLIIMFVVSSLISENFLRVNNLINLTQQMAAPTVIAMGMLFVILTGGIDLSVGSLAAVGSVLVATFCQTLSISVSIPLALLAGLAIGFITGMLVAYARLAAFIATLAMLTIGTGIAFIVSRGSPIQTPDNVLAKIGMISAGRINIVVIIAIIVVLICAFVIRFTPYGRIIMAIGSNQEVVRLAGIRTNFYLVSVYAISGFLASLGGIMTSFRTTIGSPLIGSGWELNAIAACVIGGASLMGGKGTPLRTLAGVVILSLISNIMNMIGVPSYPQSIIQGLIIIVAVVMQGFTGKAK